MEARTIFEQTDAFEVSEAGDGFILYDEARDRVHFLNVTATIIYELCQGGRSLAELVRYIDDGFALDISSLDEVRNCLSSLEAEHLVRRQA